MISEYRNIGPNSAELILTSSSGVKETCAVSIPLRAPVEAARSWVTSGEPGVFSVASGTGDIAVNVTLEPGQVGILKFSSTLQPLPAGWDHQVVTIPAKVKCGDVEQLLFVRFTEGDPKYCFTGVNPDALQDLFFSIREEQSACIDWFENGCKNICDLIDRVEAVANSEIHVTGAELRPSGDGDPGTPADLVLSFNQGPSIVIPLASLEDPVTAATVCKAIQDFPQLDTLPIDPLAGGQFNSITIGCEHQPINLLPLDLKKVKAEIFGQIVPGAAVAYDPKVGLSTTTVDPKCESHELSIPAGDKLLCEIYKFILDNNVLPVVDGGDPTQSGYLTFARLPGGKWGMVKTPVNPDIFITKATLVNPVDDDGVASILVTLSNGSTFSFDVSSLDDLPTLAQLCSILGAGPAGAAVNIGPTGGSFKVFNVATCAIDTITIAPNQLQDCAGVPIPTGTKIRTMAQNPNRPRVVTSAGSAALNLLTTDVHVITGAGTITLPTPSANICENTEVCVKRTSNDPLVVVRVSAAAGIDGAPGNTIQLGTSSSFGTLTGEAACFFWDGATWRIKGRY